jgi:preprotein translocase subunit SecD
MKSFAKLLILVMASSAAALSVVADEVIQYNLTPEKVERVKLLESQGKTTILIELVDGEKQAFSELTQRHIGQNLQIVYGEHILVQATIRAEIDSGIITSSGWEERLAREIIHDLGCHD